MTNNQLLLGRTGIVIDDVKAVQTISTPAGCDIIAAVAPHIAGTLDRIIHDRLTPEEINTLIELLGRIEYEARNPNQSG